MNPIPHRFCQANPKDQLQTLLGSLEGHLYNFRTGVITAEKFADRVEEHWRDMRALHIFMGTSWDNVESLTFRGDWTPAEQEQIRALHLPEATCTQNHTGYYLRLPQFKGDEVLWGDTVSKLVETVSRFQQLSTGTS